MSRKKGLKGQVWVERSLIPRFVIFRFFFLGVLLAEIVILIPHLLASASVEWSFWLLTVVTVVSMVIFLVEGLRFRKKKNCAKSDAVRAMF